MPPFSKELWEEGAQIKSFKLVKKGKFDEEGITKIMSIDPAQYPGCVGTRTLSDVSSRLGYESAITFSFLMPVRLNSRMGDLLI
jgi:N-methylhydantoinase B/oxoprolinase/acetone carboxylase alpha subunit